MDLVFTQIVFLRLLLLSGMTSIAALIIPPYPSIDCQIEGGKYSNAPIATVGANTPELCHQECLDNSACRYAEWLHQPNGVSQCYMKSAYEGSALQTNQTGYTLVMNECGEFKG